MWPVVEGARAASSQSAAQEALDPPARRVDSVLTQVLVPGEQSVPDVPTSAPDPGHAQAGPE